MNCGLAMVEKGEKTTAIARNSLKCLNLLEKVKLQCGTQSVPNVEISNQGQMSYQAGQSYGSSCLVTTQSVHS